mgnify:CR=1 FL=1
MRILLKNLHFKRVAYIGCPNEGTEAMKKSKAAPFLIQRPYPPPPKPVTAPSRPFPKALPRQTIPVSFLERLRQRIWLFHLHGMMKIEAFSLALL